MLQNQRTMLTPLQEQAISLYNSGKTLREVATALNHSHEWVRKVLRKAGEDARNRGREPVERPGCVVCRKECGKPDARYCSRACLGKMRHTEAISKLQSALKVLENGGTYSQAASEAGFSSAWHLWGRLHHFGMTKGLKAPARER